MHEIPVVPMFLRNSLNYYILLIDTCYDMVIIFSEQLPSNCPQTHFLCANKKCVNGYTLCDGLDDCGDRSDETTGCNGRKI